MVELKDLHAELRAFSDFASTTKTLRTSLEIDGDSFDVPTYVNEFWTAQQRAAAKLHEISYRACFKPQLPRFFIDRLTSPGAFVYDPFMGRGTTLIEAALLERVPFGCDANPLSLELIRPRLDPPTLGQVESRLAAILLDGRDLENRRDLLVFFHEETLCQIVALKKYLAERKRTRAFDATDAWIQMVATNRLTGHSPGFFSVYTLPPNQAVSIEAQIKINKRLNTHAEAEAKDVAALILRKTHSLLKDLEPYQRKRLFVANLSGETRCADSTTTAPFAAESIDLVVTSPPFLDVVDYGADNWLRNWFCNAGEPRSLAIFKDVGHWEQSMQGAFEQMAVQLRPGGFVAFEVGEVRNGSIRLEENSIRAAVRAGLRPLLVLINSQVFTKTSNCWGVDNRSKGTNTNRIVLLRKE